MVFLMLFLYDMETLNFDYKRNHREHGAVAYAVKAVCASIQLMFLYYEFYQIGKEGWSYFYDYWNYLEVTGMVLYFIGSALDLS